MSKAVIAVGTNLGNREENIRKAVRALEQVPGTRVIAASAVYETDPVGITNQPRFLNAALLLETALSPYALLGVCLGIEAACGRIRKMKDGPRILDLDLILYEGVKSESFELTLPHPRALERAFVMIPLSDLFPGGRAPGLYYGPSLKAADLRGVVRTPMVIDLCS